MERFITLCVTLVVDPGKGVEKELGILLVCEHWDLLIKIE